MVFSTKGRHVEIVVLLLDASCIMRWSDDITIVAQSHPYYINNNSDQLLIITHHNIYGTFDDTDEI